MRVTAGLFLLLAAIVLAVDLWPWATGTPFSEIRFSVPGEVWFRIHPDSYQLLEPAISRHVSPALWDHVVLPVMTAPLAVVLAILAGLAWLLRRRGGGSSGGRRDSLDLKKR